MLFLGQRTPPRIPRIPARNIIPLRGRRGRRCPPISPDRVSLSLSLDGDHWVMCVHKAARLDDNYDMMTFIRLLERLQHRVPDTLCITKHQSGWQHGFFQPAAEQYRCLSLIAKGGQDTPSNRLASVCASIFRLATGPCLCAEYVLKSGNSLRVRSRGRVRNRMNNSTHGGCTQGHSSSVIVGWPSRYQETLKGPHCAGRHIANFAVYFKSHWGLLPGSVDFQDAYGFPCFESHWDASHAG